MLFFRSLYFPLLSTFRIIWYPVNVVFGFICNSLPGWKPARSDVEGHPSSSSDPSTVAATDTNNLPTRPDDDVDGITIYEYYPPGVSEIIGRGGGSYIGFIDESTVLKYPWTSEDPQRIKTEAELLKILGSHPRIIGCKGVTEHGIILQYAPNGNVYDYITSNPVSFDQKLRWCKQVAEAVKYVHGKRVIHCDINVRNLLLDENLDILLADFQGMLKSTDGETLLDGQSRENSKSYMPRHHSDIANIKTDLFALGSAIYFIMMGHEVFPELDYFHDDDEIEALFRRGQFPTDSHACSKITDKCWRQLYESADDIFLDISQIQASKGAGNEHQNK